MKSHEELLLLVAKLQGIILATEAEHNQMNSTLFILAMKAAAYDRIKEALEVEG